MHGIHGIKKKKDQWLYLIRLQPTTLKETLIQFRNTVQQVHESFSNEVAPALSLRRHNQYYPSHETHWITQSKVTVESRFAAKPRLMKTVRISVNNIAGFFLYCRVKR
jgi:hypothetical protein